MVNSPREHDEVPVEDFRRRPGSRIVGTGFHQPERILTNADLEQMVETDDAWIQQRTGIRTRHIAGEDESVADMAIAAARAALRDARVEAAEVTQVIVATCTNAERSPSAAGRVAEALGLPGPAAFEVNAACSGFEHALALADLALRAGDSTTSLVIGAEKLSAVTDFTDRTTCILVGDGAGAAVLRPAERSGVSRVLWGTEPALAGAVRISPPSNTFSQEGRAVLGWGLREAPEVARRTVAAAGISMRDVDVFIPHQANLRMIEPLAAALGLREDAVVADDVIESGNTSAATIPLALAKLRAAGRVRPGSLALLLGFGGGFAYAGQVVELP